MLFICLLIVDGLAHDRRQTESASSRLFIESFVPDRSVIRHYMLVVNRVVIMAVGGATEFLLVFDRPCQLLVMACLACQKRVARRVAHARRCFRQFKVRQDGQNSATATCFTAWCEFGTRRPVAEASFTKRARVMLNILTRAAADCKCSHQPQLSPRHSRGQRNNTVRP